MKVQARKNTAEQRYEWHCELCRKTFSWIKFSVLFGRVPMEMEHSCQ